jgi:hypothetical protein
MGSKPSGGGQIKYPQQRQPEPKPEYEKAPRERTRTRFAGLQARKEDEARATVARKKLLGE